METTVEPDREVVEDPRGTVAGRVNLPASRAGSDQLDATRRSNRFARKWGV